ncbi:MAG: adenylate/guanylate cyclase domain-containing protein [Alphaproteobacteria bacterium]|nr:adenylate/guanylate cyclase domain-containing protein [Alphaproteobacteria bacterium]
MIRPALRALALAAASTLLVELLWVAGLLGGIEADITDAWHDIRGERSDMDVPIVLVAVDDATLDRIPDPFVFWGPRFAAAFETLRANGTTAIGLDFLTKVSGEDFFRRNGMDDLPISRTWDASFRSNLFQKDVVLVGSRVPKTDDRDLVDLPIGEFLLMIGSARSNVGLDNLPHDADGKVRRWRPVVAAELASDPRAPVHSLSLALALHHLGLPADAGRWEIAGHAVEMDDSLERIVFRGPPGTWPRVPFWKLTEPGALTDAEKALLHGAIAIVGATHTGSTDRLRSPFGEQLMPGAEVHANALGTLLSGRRLHALPLPGRAGLVLLLTWLAATAFLLSDVRAGGAALGATALAVPLVGYAAFSTGDLLFPVASVELAVGVAFAGAFTWRYLGEESEKRHLRRVFQRYVSDAVVDDILSSPDGLRLGGERRQITVLFTDIRNFTTFSEDLEPEEIVEMLNVYFDRACRPILDQGGVVDKFIGDAIMAVFGAPVGSDDHADRAIAAALEISRAADGFREWMAARFPDRELPVFDIGIGIHTGAAVVGNIGFERRTEYTVIGDAVNVASRLEGLTKTVGCRLLVSRDALAAAKQGYQTGRSADMSVKGREEPVAVVEITGRSQ